MQQLLILHGAIGASDQFKPLQEKLNKDFKTLTLNFSGHGGMPFPEDHFSIRIFAEEVLSYLNVNGIKQIDIFGYSMGGYVAMFLAKHHPDRVGKIVTLASKFHWDEATAAKEVKMIDANKIIEKVPAFAAALEKRHQPNDWKELLIRTQHMLHSLGKNNTLKPEDYERIENPSLILLGDKDNMITLEETVRIYKALPNAQMGMLPATKHPIEQANIGCLVFMLKQFLK